MKQNQISLCMIVKNEEHNLARCLDSIKGYVDQLIIVDTGSTDKTIDIAKGYGAVIVNEFWRNNFSLARNVSLDHANCEWIMFLDADEELINENLDQLKGLDSSVDGYFVQVLNIDDDGNVIKNKALRIFKNHPRHRFQGAIHEQIVASIIENNPKAKFLDLDIKINHFGYQNKLVTSQNKITRNIEILQSEYNQGNIDSYLLYNLGAEYLRAGNFDQALSFFNEAETLIKPELSYTHLLYKKKIQTLMLLHQYQEALANVGKYLTLFPDYTDLMFLKATAHYHLGNYQEALQSYQHCLRLGEPPNNYVSEQGVGSIKAQSAIENIKKIIVKNAAKAPLKAGISLCMIVCNEEKNLARCLQGMHEVVDEIIVVDTGSVDKTAEVAKENGAKLYHYHWTGDFSAARNYSLTLANYQWILVLDADEVLRKQDYSRLLNTIVNSNPDQQGFYLKIVNYFDHDDPDDFVVDAVCRLFRNNNNFRFQSSLHEEIAQSIISLCGTNSISPIEIHIDHWGYLLPKVLNHKNNRNTLILNKAMQIQPDDPYTLYALGTEYFQQAKFEEALGLYNRAIKQLKDAAVLSDLYFKIVVCHLELKQYSEGLAVIQQGLQHFPDFTSLWYLKGLIEFQQNLLPQACKTWRKTLAIGEPPWYQYTFPNGIGSFRTAAALVNCLISINLLTEAEDLIKNYIKQGQGIGSLALPFANLMIKKYGVTACIGKIKEIIPTHCFRTKLLLADAFTFLEQPELASYFLSEACKIRNQGQFIKEREYIQLTVVRLKLIAKLCEMGLKNAGGDNKDLFLIRQRITSMIKRRRAYDE